MIVCILLFALALAACGDNESASRRNMEVKFDRMDFAMGNMENINSGFGPELTNATKHYIALVRKYAKDSAYNIAYVLAYRGEADRAFEWLDKAAAYHDPGLATIVVNPLFANIHQDPRWLPFLRNVGKAPEQLAAIKFDVKLPN